MSRISRHTLLTLALIIGIGGFITFASVEPAYALLEPGKVTDIKAQAGAVAGDQDTTDAVVDPRMLAFQIIQIFLGVLGTIMMVMVFMSGYWYLTARGREEQITKAMDTMRRAIIGLVIIFASYGIARFVISNVEGAIDEGYGYYQEKQRLNDNSTQP